MQIMSSPSMSDAADTPVSGSGGSPSPQSPSTTTLKQVLDFSKKECGAADPANGISSKIMEATDCARSDNSSPATLVPTPRSTPPMNGILTPPNDVEGSSEPCKVGKPAGRLKFFKDGILCLELSHHNEGEKTKWVQIRTKTVFPTLVHAVKEATIPCHSTPSSFASPSSLTHNHRVESSTSHSLSDDASSMLSSPRVRESHWKQPVPQRGVSTCLQFYMKPAPCALKVRCKVKEISHSQDQLRKRWPYNYRRTDIFMKLANCVQCLCDDLSHVLKDSSNNSSEEKDSDDIDSKRTSLTKALKRKTKTVKLRQVSIHSVVENLEKLAQSQAVISRELNKTKSTKSNGEANEFGKRHSSGKTSVVTPKKRLFNEVEPKDPGNIRPKKKSPNRSHDVGKTILNVPGLNSEFYKRHTSSKPPSIKTPGRNSPMAGLEVSGYDPRSKSVPESAVHKRNNRSPHFGAKSISPGSSSTSSSTTLKPGLTAELVDRFSPLPGRNNYRLSDEHLSPRHHSLSSHLQEQKYLQQQTLSKTISYTINSLLGTSAIGDEPSTSQGARSGGYEQLRHSQRNDTASLPNLQNNQRGSRQSTGLHSGAVGSRPDQDQKSFLRHLLDTSDPIPSVKSVDRTNRNTSRSSHPTNHTSRSGGLKASKTSNNNNNNHENVTTNSASLLQKVTNRSSGSSQGSHLPADPITEAHQSIATNLALSSLMTSFPLAPSYDLLTRGANPHSTEAIAAAAAALQYGSLIPGNIFPPVNSTMAAAMASYFGVMPNFHASGTPSSQSPSPSSSKSSTRRNEDNLNRSQRSWSGMVNGHPPASSSPFRSSSAPSTHSQNSSGRSSSAISRVEVSSCGALNLSERRRNRVEETPEAVDMDAPLDLCKKSSR